MLLFLAYLNLNLQKNSKFITYTYFFNELKYKKQFQLQQFELTFDNKRRFVKIKIQTNLGINLTSFWFPNIQLTN